jgi:hypothetical protein
MNTAQMLSDELRKDPDHPCRTPLPDDGGLAETTDARQNLPDGSAATLAEITI